MKQNPMTVPFTEQEVKAHLDRCIRDLRKRKADASSRYNRQNAMSDHKNQYAYGVVRAETGRPIDPCRVWSTKAGVTRFLERRRRYGDTGLRAVRLTYTPPNHD